MNDKFAFAKDEAQRINNDDLDCKDCKCAYNDRTIDCVEYRQKPLSVLMGKECKKKR